MTAMELNELEKESEKPPSRNGNRPHWLVAVIANVKGEIPASDNLPADAGAEYDRPETIQAIRDSIESDGHTTIFLPANRDLPVALREFRPDMCFNIAEGYGPDAREAHVPALLAMMGIPYTASTVVANAISLDKVVTKRLWREARLPIAPFQEFNSPGDPLRPNLRFPMFVKPAREGTGMGVDAGAKVTCMTELRDRVAWVLKTYRQPALVENYLPGREFTVGVLGRQDARQASFQPHLYRTDGFHRFPILEIDGHSSITPGVYGHDAKSIEIMGTGAPDFICPANISKELESRLHNLAIRGHKAIGALDISRVDIRLDENGNPNLIEINTLPGLTPDFSDLCILAKTEGISYRTLILEILYLAAARYEMIPAHIPVYA